jgi:hypothetical protein
VDCIRRGFAASRIEPAFAGIFLLAIGFQFSAFSFSLPLREPIGRRMQQTRQRRAESWRLKADSF